METNKKRWDRILKGMAEGNWVTLMTDRGLPEEGEIVHIFENFPYVMVAYGEKGGRPVVSLWPKDKIIEVKKT